MPTHHDVGGKREHFGPVAHTPSEPAFLADWERRVFGITSFVMSLLRLDVDNFRARVERLPPNVDAAPYYTHWLGAIESTLVDLGYLDATKSVPAQRVQVPMTSRLIRWFARRPTVPRWMAARVLPHMYGNSRQAKSKPRFGVGDEVRVLAPTGDGHTRRPGYSIGRRGRIADLRGAAVFADARAAGQRARPEHVYAVAFDGAELWGRDAEPNTEIVIELFEPYLEPA